MPNISFYKGLNSLSTADFYPKNIRKASASRFYEIKRVVSKRFRKGKVSDCFDTTFALIYRVEA